MAQKFTLNVNGKAHSVEADPDMPLLYALRDDIGLNNPRFGCGLAQCGACTVHINGRSALSCLTLAASVEGQDITTIEGLAGRDGKLHPMQQAFVDNDAFQCGYCTPGQIMAAVACVKEGHARSDAAIREYMSGNLCRCAAYPNIVDAIKQTSFEMGEG